MSYTKQQYIPTPIPKSKENIDTIQDTAATDTNHFSLQKQTPTQNTRPIIEKVTATISKIINR